MTTEEKAKAYDKALTFMKDCIPDKDGYVCVRPCDIFQELKESEDEITRKSLILYLENKKKAQEEAKYYQGVEGFERWIAWLERQAPKPKWKQEDDENLRDIISAIHYIPYQTTEAEVERTDWLQSLKQRMEEQQ